MANDLALNAQASRRAGGFGPGALLRDPWFVLLLALVALGAGWALTDLSLIHI